MRKSIALVTGLTALLLLAGSASAAVNVWDNFAGGLTIGNPGSSAKWFYFGAPGFVGDDGVAQTGPFGGVVVAPPARNPMTHFPAFSKTVAPESQSGLPGAFDHVKWLIYMNHFSSHGFPGFDPPASGDLVCKSTVAGQVFGTSANPFGKAVSDPQDDLRLASVAMNVIDFETFMVFDVFFTNERIYAFYEHLPFARASLGGTLDNYAAFSYAIPIATRTSPFDFDTVEVHYNKSAGTVSWWVDGKKKFAVDHLGFRIDRKFMLLDHGGAEESFAPNQLDCGMGMFTLLDGYGPKHTGLVQLSETPNFYFNPEKGEPNPPTFVDPLSALTSRLFGQGAAIEAFNASVGTQ